MGLGNPGAEYASTRHNAGFLAADALATRWEFPPFKRPWRWRARVSRGSFGGHDIVLVKPQTYMNRSGTALGPVLEQPGFAVERDLLVVVDDFALPLGTIRVRARGSPGGHNGLKSVAGRLATNEYARLRIGVGPTPEDHDPADYVLDDFTPADLKVLNELMPDVVDCIECWVRDGVEAAMNRYNRRGNAE